MTYMLNGVQYVSVAVSAVGFGSEVLTYRLGQ
jgi:hypothetical protein